jgi:hypothetical protein
LEGAAPERARPVIEIDIARAFRIREVVGPTMQKDHISVCVFADARRSTVLSLALSQLTFKSAERTRRNYNEIRLEFSHWKPHR